ncbi:unnamed protein product [Prorocentrum cordatum]|uniref:Uncharacterized protein n=1 Tax=Prorocentrum cordatum TaxID=2364126 RepID=A0ABN9XGX3_9DINO|nr:unnamed protein product [Polarella glacialis]
MTFLPPTSHMARRGPATIAATISLCDLVFDGPAARERTAAEQALAAKTIRLADLLNCNASPNARGTRDARLAGPFAPVVSAMRVPVMMPPPPGLRTPLRSAAAVFVPGGKRRQAPLSEKDTDTEDPSVEGADIESDKDTETSSSMDAEAAASERRGPIFVELGL